MARHTPLPRFRLEADALAEHSAAGAQAAAPASRILQPYQPVQLPLQPPRYQVRFRRSACSDLQSSTIPEGRVYNDNQRRASLFIGRSSESTLATPKLSTFDEAPSECDYIQLCRQRCQSLYGSLPSSTTVSAPVSPLVLTDNALTVASDDEEDDDDDDDDVEEDDDEDERGQVFDATATNNFRHSLPDASPAGLAIRNFLKRNKSRTNNNNNHHRLGVPSQSSQSLCSSRSSSSSILTSSSSPLSTFRNFLSLVKLPSSSSSSSSTAAAAAAAATTTARSIISTTSSASTTPHHSSLTTLTGATGGSSTTLDHSSSTLSLKKRSGTNTDAQSTWHFNSDQSQWCSADGTSAITLGPIELHNLTYAEHKQLKRLALQRLQTTQYDLGVPIHVPKEEPARKRKHHFMFRSKSSDKSKEAREAKSNGNVFGVALAQCVIDDDVRFQEETMSTSPPACLPTSSGTTRKDSVDMIVITTGDRRTSPSGSVSSTNDSGYSVSPASPSSLHISDSDYEQNKLRSLSLEALAENEAGAGVNRCNTLRCYPAKVPELIQNCCDYLEKNALQTVGLFRVGVSKKRLKELKEQVNSSRNLTFDDTTNAHDIAGLIKEFLRELPEPLLTRDLCAPFLNIPSRLHTKDQSRALSYLIALLPSSNRDTLYTLLKFLHQVSLNAQDRCSNDGKVLSAGNKMDAANLAIVFAPTILMDGKAPVISSKDMTMATSADQMEQGKTILKMMIEQYKELFVVPKDLHDQVSLALNDLDNNQLMRALSFKVQQGCGILSMQLDDANERLLMSLDLSPIVCETPSATSSILSSIIPQSSRSSQQPSGPILRRYNHRRNSDFPCSSTHSSRSSEFLQVPMSSSQQRLSNHNQPAAPKLPRVRDIREASMDQIIFRVIEPFSSAISETQEPARNSTEPIISISSFDDIITVPIMRPNTLDIKESPPSSPVLRAAAAPPSTGETATLREIKPYSRSKTAPLSMSSGTQNFLSVKRREARDLCGSSSNDDSPSPTNAQHSTLV